MRVTAATLALFATASLLGAQQPAKPYQEGEVQSFLERARENSRPAIVLFNFNLDTG